MTLNIVKVLLESFALLMQKKNNVFFLRKWKMLTGFALNDDFFILKMRSTIDNIIIRNNAIANQINIS